LDEGWIHAQDLERPTKSNRAGDKTKWTERVNYDSGEGLKVGGVQNNLQAKKSHDVKEDVEGNWISIGVIELQML
jgi:hypothetical protein